MHFLDRLYSSGRCRFRSRQTVPKMTLWALLIAAFGMRTSFRCVLVLVYKTLHGIG